MPILVMCSNPGCGELFDVPDDFAGRRVTCPACGTVLAVATAAPGPVGEGEKPPVAPPPGPIAPGKPARGPAEAEDLPDLRPAEPADVERPRRPRAVEPARPPLPAEVQRPRRPAAKKPPRPPTTEPPGDDLHAPPRDSAGRSRRRAPAPPPPVEEVLPPGPWEERLDDLLGAAEPGEGATATAVAVGYGILEHRLVKLVVFAVGLIGMAGGLLLGVILLPGHPILAGYVGAGLGWIGGFLLAFLMVLAVEREEPGKVRCGFCRNVFPAGTETCQYCGMRLTVARVTPLAGECLRAGRYALSKPSSLYWLVMLLVGGDMLLVGVVELLRRFPDEAGAWQPALVAACALAGFVIFAYWMQYLLAAISETIGRFDEAPDAPRFWTLRNAATGFKAIAVLAVYVVPLFTMPMLPLGFLALAAPGGGGPFDLARTARDVWRHARDFTILWLLLLLWLSGLALAILVSTIFLDRLVGLLTPVAGGSGIVLRMLVWGGVTAVVGGIGGVFVLAMFRCIGLFGRYNAAALLRRQAGEEQQAAQPQS